MQEEKQERNLTSPSMEGHSSPRQSGQEAASPPATELQTDDVNPSHQRQDNKVCLDVHGTDSNSPQNRRNPLLEAARNGDASAMSELLSSNHPDVDVQDPFTLETPLMIGAKLGHLNIVQQCLAANANVDILSIDGATALLYAVKPGFTAIVQALLEAHANVHIADSHGDTAIKLAVRNHHAEIAWLLYDHGAESIDVDGFDSYRFMSVDDPKMNGDIQAQLCQAAADGDLPVVQRLLQAGIDANSVSKDEQTPLLLACFHNHDAVIKELLEYGADVNCTDWLGRSPLYHAAKHGEYALASTLIALGATADPVDKLGWSPLLIAARFGFVDIVELLVDNHASQSRRNIIGKNARELAKGEVHDAVVNVLDAQLESYRIRRIAALEASNFDTAAHSFGELMLKVDSPEPCDVLLRCQALVRQGDVPFALVDAQSYMQYPGDKTADGFAFIGDLYFREAPMFRAMDAYKAGLDLDPQHAVCLAGVAKIWLTKDIERVFVDDALRLLNDHALYQEWCEDDHDFSAKVNQIVVNPRVYDARDMRLEILKLILQHLLATDPLDIVQSSLREVPMRETLPDEAAITQAFENEIALFVSLASDASTVACLGDKNILTMIRHIQEDPTALWTTYWMDASMASIVNLLFQDAANEDDVFVLVETQDDDEHLS
ncbi:hypothetical protein AeMF1_014833 [Aphanomyces euteiches]|nr:hypothetical protein AeMF1_014833 [Aphanomyces euteiches]KAH9186137.1 hypothetical protein AeNC1_011888 [Aphanomyces euteiches]